MRRFFMTTDGALPGASRVSRVGRAIVFGLVVATATSGCGGALTGSSAPGLASDGVSSTTATPWPAQTPTLVPVAALAWGGGMTVGALGSYVMDGRGGDSPWLPFAVLEGVTVSADARVVLQFQDRSRIGAWVVDLAPADDPTGGRARRVADRGEGPEVGEVEVGPLPRGRWVLAARLFRADGRGDGTTYWAVSVP